MADLQLRGFRLPANPDSPCVLGASGRPDLRHDSVAEELEANVLILGSPHDPLVIVGVDALYPGDLRHLLDESGVVNADRLLLAASHTHRAPMTDSGKPRLGQWEPDYTRRLADRIARALRASLGAEGTPATMSWGDHATAFTINRRRRVPFRPGGPRRWGSVVMRPNATGVTDDHIRVIVFRSAGRPVGVVWSLACHPVGHHAPTTVAAHFPGVVRRLLRQRLAVADLPVVFVQGFSGNTRPAPTAGPARRSRIVDWLAPRPFRDMTPDGYRTWTQDIAGTVVSVATGATETLPVYEWPRSVRITRPSAEFVQGGTTPVTFQRLDVGPQVAIIGTSAEVVAEYREPIAAGAGVPHVMTCGCLDDTFGYAPTRRQIDEGGYEAGEYCQNFGLTGVSPTIETNLLAGFAALSPHVADSTDGGGPAA